MSESAPDAVIGEFIAAFNAHDADRIVEVVADESCQEAVLSMLARFPDVQLEVRRQISDGDTVAVLARAHGSHTADMPGFAANGEQFSCRYQGMYRIEDGRIADLWTVWEILGLLGQIGAPPDLLAGMAKMRAAKSS